MSGGTPRLLHVFPVFHVGGAQVRFVDIANHFGRRLRHDIISLDPDASCAERLDPDLDMTLSAGVMERGGLVGTVRAYRKRLAAARPDLLVTYGWNAIEWVLANRIRPVAPLLHFEDGFSERELGDNQIAKRVMVRRVGLNQAGATVLVPSATLRELAIKRWRLKPERVAFIPNAIEAARFDAGPDPTFFAERGLERLIGPARPPLVGALAFLRAEKNLGRLLRVFRSLRARLPETELMIFGEGPEQAALEASARELGIAEAVHFTGAVDRPERVIGALDIFAITSDTEQMPYSLMEAMAASRAVVATDVGDVAGMLSEENRAYVFARDDEAGLADGAARLLADPSARAVLGAANRTRAKTEFAAGAMLARYQNLFEKLINRPI